MSDTKPFPQSRKLVLKFMLRNFGGNLPVFDNKHPIGQRCRETEVLLHENDRVVPLLELVDDLPKLLHNYWSQTLRDFIE